MIRDVKYRPALLFGGIALLLFAAAFFQDAVLDIYFIGTYFVVTAATIHVMFGILFLFFALIYFLFEKNGRPLNKRSGYFHYGISIISVLVLLVSALFAGNTPRSHTSGIFTHLQFLNWMIVITAGLFVLGQFLFLVTVLRNLFLKSTRQ